MNIIIQTTPHKNQRYNTVGDYWIDAAGGIQVRISEMNNRKYEFLVALHELVELELCKKAGIDYINIDQFDQKFEVLRVEHPDLIGEQEPGDMKSAPYYDQHQKATQIEKLMASYLGVNWQEYEKAVNEL